MLDWLLGKHAEPAEIKKLGAFKVMWFLTPHRAFPAKGVEVSESGLVFQVDKHIPGNEFTLDIELRGHQIRCRVHCAHMDQAPGPSGPMFRYTCKFTGIAADDYDRVSRYLRDQAEPVHEGSLYDPSKPDDDYRLLPTRVQQQILADLVARNRLIIHEDGTAPLIRMQSMGTSRNKKGESSQRIAIHSRILVEGEEHKDFDTKYVITGDGVVLPQ